MLTILINSLDKTIHCLEELQEEMRKFLKKIGEDKKNKEEFLCRLRQLRYLLLNVNSIANDIFLNINEEE